MLKITIITIGKLKERAFVELEDLYRKMLSPFAKLNIVEIPEEPYRKENEAEKSRRKEAEKILKLLRPGTLVIALDENGKKLSTQGFASVLAAHAATGREFVFVIGSSSGLDEKIKRKANWLLSLSPMTFTHNFSRVLLEEQLYRAATLLAGKTYHK